MMISMRPIGLIHTPFSNAESTPIQSVRSEAAGEVEVFPEFQEGLAGIEEFSHLILLYSFHRSLGPVRLTVKPFLDNQLHGLFTTRFPNRPNPLGLSVVRLVSRTSNRLEILGVDMLDGTPLLDIKPYIPDFDIHQVTNTGWYARRSDI
jgi:tRNA-Thr(GGU) m(6)t(6)A37 methyltransferase TsaA